MLENTNLFLNPDYVTDQKSCFQAIEELSNQIESKTNQPHLDFLTGVYIWGTEEVARRIVLLLEELNIPLLGIFDSDVNKQGHYFGKYEIQSPRAVNNYVVVCSYNQPAHLESARELLGERALAAWELLILNSKTQYLPWNNLRKPSQLTLQEKDRLGKVGNRIHATSIHEYWKQVAAHHFVGILHNNQVGSFSNEEEYFVPGLIKTLSDSVFLDLGAYNGDTINRFFNQPIGMSDSRKAIGVEADRNNYSELMRKFNERSDVILLNAVIGNESGLVPFSQSPSSMGSSALFFEANTIIPSITIDQIFQKMKFSHAKFDIEGFERMALQGARVAIEEGDAVWSVASYHLYDDFWVLPSFFSEDYEMHVTRHAPLPWDTTMHFMRK
jgi:FkbM family methyltransferase